MLFFSSSNNPENVLIFMFFFLNECMYAFSTQKRKTLFFSIILKYKKVIFNLQISNVYCISVLYFY